jgi:ankyrin repeat protein
VSTFPEHALRAACAALVLALCTPAAAQDGLIAAAERGETLVVRRLLAEGVPVNTRDGRGRTALLAATQRNHLAVARLLINEGADVNAKDLIQDTPFLVAGAEGRVEILKLMLAADADLTSTNRFGGTALIPACHRGHVEAVKLLLATAIDKDHVNHLGFTALMEAVILSDGGPNHAEIVRLLVVAGANVNIPDRDGITPLAHARQRGYGAIVAILEAAGAR